MAVENARPHFPKEVVRLELYRLACYFLASKHLRDLSDGSDDCPYQPLRDEFEQSEIVRILICLASSGRIICDGLKRGGYDSVIQQNIVGTIRDDVTKKEVKHLNVLQACSKLLHARVVVPKTRYQGNPYRRYLRPSVILYSDESRDVGWRADISVVKFVAAFSNIAT
jgi:hypothetical protein